MVARTPSSASDLLEAAETIRDIRVARATGDQAERDADYRRHRKTLTDAPSLRTRVPSVVLKCRTLFEFWGFIKPKFPTYEERRAFLKEEFDPLLTMLEVGASSPGDEAPTEMLARLDWDEVQLAWRKALERKTTDPEGAITTADRKSVV